MQTITTEERDLLVSHLQAGAHGFRGRIEIDWVVGGSPSIPTITDHAAEAGFNFGVSVTVGSGLTDSALVAFVTTNGTCTGVVYNPDPISSPGGGVVMTRVGTAATGHGCEVTAWVLTNPAPTSGSSVYSRLSSQISGGGGPSGCAVFLLEGVDPSAPIADTTSSTTAANGDPTISSSIAGGSRLVLDAVGFGERWDATCSGTPDSPQTLGDTAIGSSSFGLPGTSIQTSYATGVTSMSWSGLPDTSCGAAPTWPLQATGQVVVAVGLGSGGTINTSSYEATRIALDRSRKMAAAQLDADFTNEDYTRGWYTETAAIFVPNNVVRAYEWHGDPANEVQVFTGILDRIHEHRDPRQLDVSARSRMKWLLEQTFVATAPQDASDPSAVRTEANGVYIGKSPEYIVGDILDRAGWPSADRVIGSSGITIDEYDLTDGGSWADQIAGADRLTTSANFDFWEDELGIVHFEASPITAGVEPTADYTFQAGVDVMVIDHETDDTDRVTRVRVTGPMTTAEGTWEQEWGTSVLTYPVGAWYDPSDTTHLRVIDGVTRYLYTLRISDRVITSKVYLGGSVSYPLGLSGDPADSTIYWVLNATWRYGSGTTAAIHKFRKSDNAHLASYSLPSGQWSDIKSDGNYLYLTNYGDGKIYRRSRVDGSAVANYTIVYQSVTQTQPTGLYVNGSTLGYFFFNTQRFLLASTSAPGTITGTQSTKGTGIAGGEYNTTSGTELFAVSDKGSYDNAGHVWEFKVANLVSRDITKWAYNQALEDALGFQSQIANRVHDLHPGDPAHPFEIRVGDYPMKVINSEAQAQAVANAQLVLLERLRRQFDVGTLGNPAIQINDVIAVTDPVSAVSGVWIVDTYRSEMAGDGIYTSVWSVLPWE